MRHFRRTHSQLLAMYHGMDGPGIKFGAIPMHDRHLGIGPCRLTGLFALDILKREEKYKGKKGREGFEGGGGIALQRVCGRRVRELLVGASRRVKV